MAVLEDTAQGFPTELLTSSFAQQIGPLILTNQTNNSICSTTYCHHPVFIQKICTRCGIRSDNLSAKVKTVPFWYVHRNMSLSHDEINRLREANLKTLLRRRKLHLVLDLDHTLVHTRVSWKLTPEDRQFLRNKNYGVDYFHNAAENCDESTLFKMADGWTKLRPFVRTFLQEASQMFDMSIYTLSCRACAWATAKALDPDGTYFGMWRVITREDCVDLDDKHKKSLDVVLEHERVVLIIDDGISVWDDHNENLIKIKPYNYFSYDSPHEDVEKDASPPKKSWSQLGGDERADNGELARILETLRDVHRAFYDGSLSEEEYARRDASRILQRVLKAQKTTGKKQKNRSKKNK